MRCCGCSLERGSAQDPPLRDSYRGSESPPAEVVLFSERGYCRFFARNLSAHITGIELVWADRYVVGQARRTDREGGFVGWRRVEGWWWWWMWWCWRWGCLRPVAGQGESSLVRSRGMSVYIHVLALRYMEFVVLAGDSSRTILCL